MKSREARQEPLSNILECIHSFTELTSSDSAIMIANVSGTFKNKKQLRLI